MKSRVAAVLSIAGLLGGPGVAVASASTHHSAKRASHTVRRADASGGIGCNGTDIPIALVPNGGPVFGYTLEICINL